MLFDPAFLVEPAIVLVTMSAVAKAVTAFAVGAPLRRRLRVAPTAAAALSHMGEFSFILGPAEAWVAARPTLRARFADAHAA